VAGLQGFIAAPARREVTGANVRANSQSRANGAVLRPSHAEVMPADDDNRHRNSAWRCCEKLGPINRQDAVPIVKIGET
jgi:hypothetical protein